MNALKAHKRNRHILIQKEKEKTLNLLSTMSDEELKEWSAQKFAEYDKLKQQLIEKGQIKL